MRKMWSLTLKNAAFSEKNCTFQWLKSSCMEFYLQLVKNATVTGGFGRGHVPELCRPWIRAWHKLTGGSYPSLRPKTTLSAPVLEWEICAKQSRHLYFLLASSLCSADWCRRWRARRCTSSTSRTTSLRRWRASTLSRNSRSTPSDWPTGPVLLTDGWLCYNYVARPFDKTANFTDRYRYTRGRSNMAKCAMVPKMGPRSPVWGHVRWLKKVPLNFWDRVSY